MKGSFQNSTSEAISDNSPVYNRGDMGSCMHYKKHGEGSGVCRKCIKKRMAKMVKQDRNLKFMWNMG